MADVSFKILRAGKGTAGLPIFERAVGAVREPPASPQSGRKTVAHGASPGGIGPSLCPSPVRSERNHD